MKFTFFLVVLFLIGTASAVQVNETLGPYKISFHAPMNTMINRSVEHSETYEGIGLTRYELNFYNEENNYQTCYLCITNYNQTINIDLSNNTLQSEMIHQGYILPKEYTQTIDNHPGVLVVGENTSTLPTVYQWKYLLDNYTMISGWSNLPWDEGTLQFLKALHIERA